MRDLLVKLLFHLFSALPLPVAHTVGTALGWIFFVLSNNRRRTAEINLALCFPETDASARRRLLRRNLTELGKTIAEVGVLWTCRERDLRRLIRRVSGEDKVKQAMARGKGLILALPHLGAWETIGLWGSLNYPMTSLYRTPRMSQMSQLVRSARERFGARLVATDNSGIRALYQALERGEMVAILPDQVPARGAAVFAPFFGIPASTMVLLSRLAIKTGAPVVFGYAERLPRGHGYHLHFLSAPAEINRGNVESSAAAVNAMVEKCVRAVPEQYQWIYKRFRKRPAGETAFY